MFPLSKSSKGNIKNPRFFCENCGEEVPRNAKNCPKCGRSFASVLCPSCGFSGGESLFREGCPACGYSSKERKEQDPRADSAGSFPDFSERKKPAGALPFWLYILTAAGFAVILIALFFTIFR